jgi:hypothetical protein
VQHDPASHAARVALSHALRVVDRGDDATQVLAEYLSAARRRDLEPWVQYGLLMGADNDATWRAVREVALK